MHQLNVLVVKCKFLKFPSTSRKVQTSSNFNVKEVVRTGNQYDHQCVKLLEKQSGAE